MKWTYFTKLNGDVDVMPYHASRDSLTEIRVFVGEDVTNIEHTPNADGIPRAKWDGTEYTTDNTLLIENKLDELYHRYNNFQILQVDSNTKDELDKSETLVENGPTVTSDLPLATALGTWIQDLWAAYYVEKANVDENYTVLLDEGNYTPVVPSGYHDIRNERLAHLATM